MLITIIQGTNFESICEYIKTAIFKFTVRRARAPNNLRWPSPELFILMYLYEDTPFGFYAEFCYYKVELEDVDGCVVFAFNVLKSTLKEDQIKTIEELLAEKMLAIKNGVHKIKNE